MAVGGVTMDKAAEQRDEARSNMADTDAQFFAAAFVDAMTVDSGEAVGAFLPDPEHASGVAIAASEGWYRLDPVKRLCALTSIRKWAMDELTALGAAEAAEAAQDAGDAATVAAQEIVAIRQDIAAMREAINAMRRQNG